MKSLLVKGPGDYGLVEHEIPAPGPEQVLVRVGAVGICHSDLDVISGRRPAGYVRYPVVLGHEWAGEITQMGKLVVNLQVGDRVAVEGHNYCRYCRNCEAGATNLCEKYHEFGFTLDGGYSQYVAVRADLVHPFGRDLSITTAALTEPLSVAVSAVKRSGVRPGEVVVIIGPGSLGLLATAYFNLYSPARLILVSRHDLPKRTAQAMGATDVAIGAKEAEALVMDITSGRGADVVLEAAGSEKALALALHLARRGGTVVATGNAGDRIALPVESDIFCLKELTVRGVFAYNSMTFVETLRVLESGVLDVTPIISDCLPLVDYERAFEILLKQEAGIVKMILYPNEGTVNQQ